MLRGTSPEMLRCRAWLLAEVDGACNVTSAAHQHCREKGGAFRHGLCNDVFAG